MTPSVLADENQSPTTNGWSSRTNGDVELPRPILQDFVNSARHAAPSAGLGPPSNGVKWARYADHSRPSSSSSTISQEHEQPVEPLRRRFSHPVKSFGPHTTPAGGPQSRVYSKIKGYSDDPDTQQFPRISKPVELLRTSYDTVVIGSGYGGGVAASRMARAGHSVCLLERGQEKWPGEYPSKLTDATKELHISGALAPSMLGEAPIETGDPTGLYHLIMGKGQNAFVGNGLGGTSLLNANIYLETDDETMAMPCWPPELREPGSLKKYYKRAEEVLEPRPYPLDWPTLPKLDMLEKQARALGFHEKFKRPRQTTRFRSGPNSTGVEMYPSALTGMDATGVNDGSKSSTLVNYLADAWNWGAEMFCECEVRYIKKHPSEPGYLIFFAWHGRRRGAFKGNLYEDLMWVHAKKCLFLGAGSIGTTEILLRSKSLGLRMSSSVGTGMSGNGDILAFGYNTEDHVNAIGQAHPSPYNPVGPTISGIIDCRSGHQNPLDGFVIEEGAIPHALAPLFQAMLELLPTNDEDAKALSGISRLRHLFSSMGSQILGPYFKKGSIMKTQVYLVMSHDSNQAILTLENDKPMLEFLGVGRSDHVAYLNNLLREATVAVGGKYVDSPFYATFGQEITVHPIGGACISRDGTADSGVTNSFGELLTGDGSEIYPGLVVVDGAVIPCALGVNPFATITALAERAVEHAAIKMDVEINFKQKNGILDLFGEPQFTLEKRNIPRDDPDNSSITSTTTYIHDRQVSKASGFGFTEVMSGFIHVGDNLQGDRKEDFETAAKMARGLCEGARFFLSVKAWDTKQTIHRSDHSAMLTGTFVCASLPGSPFLVQRGDFHLFNVDHQAPGTKNLNYEFDMISVDKKRLHFCGHKIIDSSVALGPWRFWKAASTLYVTITDTNEEKTVLGRGMLHISMKDFVSEMFTLQASGRSLFARAQSSVAFLGYFARQSASLFFSPFTWLQYPAVTYTGYINDTPPDRTIRIVSSDNVQTLMHVWESRNPDIPTKDLFMIPGASVDHQIFALPTIEVNAVNYFTRAGYRVFVTVHRICHLMTAERDYTTFDSRLDLRACLEYIRSEQTDPEPIYTICHCMGAVAFSSGLLDGTIPAHWIKGITCSQVFMNPIWAPLNMAKVLMGPIPFDKLYKMIAGNWYSCSSSKDDSWFQQFLNQLLRFYPDYRKEMCNNVSCHRCSLVFGRLWNHNNLNEATHRQTNRFFGGVNMTLLHLLMQMGRRGVVTTNAPLCHALPTRRNLRRLAGLPIALFSGADNQVLAPESTDRTYSALRDTFGGTEAYERWVVQGYGHLDCWMGRRAWRDVWGKVREGVDRVCRGPDYRYRVPDWDRDWKTWRDAVGEHALEGKKSV